MTATAGDSSALRLGNVDAGYGGAAVLRDVSLDVPCGSVVALLGANGAGKTSLLRVAAGLLRPTGGSVELDGKSTERWSADRVARAGLCLVPEGRGIYRSLTVGENLQLFAPRGASLDVAIETFPLLGRRLPQVAGTLSGGEQQQLALSRAFLCKPSVVLLDEVSMGLSPVAVEVIFSAIKKLAEQGIALLIVEQYVHQALAIASYAYLLSRGCVVHHAPAAEIDVEDVMRSYIAHSATTGSARRAATLHPIATESGFTEIQSAS